VHNPPASLVLIHSLTPTSKTKWLEEENSKLQQQLALVHCDVNDIEEFPELPHEDQFNNGEIPSGHDVHGHHSISLSTLAFYDHGLATLVLF
jgi:hypothetical protein